jgi:hypothetical protein
MSRAHILRLLAAGAVLATGFVLLDGYITDDTYIHLRYAENLLAHREFAFNPGEHSYGATSPLWVMGLTLLIGIGVPPLTAAWLLGLICAVAALLLFDALLTRLPFRALWKFWLLLLMAADAWFLRWARSGMETPLATVVLIALLWPLVAERRAGGWLTADPGRSRWAGPPLWHRYLAWGVAAGLAGLTRPEFLLLAPLALPWLLWFEYFRASDAGGAQGRVRARPIAPALAAGAGWLLIVGPWLAYAQVVFGRITPGTAAAKSGAIDLVPGEVFAVVLRAATQLAVVQGPLWVGLGVLVLLALVLRRDPDDVLSSRARDGEEPELLPPPGLWDRPADTGRWSIWLAVALVMIPFTWTVVLVGGYALKQVWLISRYLSPLTPLVLLAGGLLSVWLVGSLGRTRARRRLGLTPLLTGVAASLVLNGAVLVLEVLPHARQFPEGLERCYVGMGHWLRDNTPPNTVVAALDIGALGYASERHILDLMGLVSPEILRMGREMGFQDLVESGAWLHARDPAGRRPDYLVDRTAGPPRWAGASVRGVTFELLDTCVIQGVGLREPQPWTIALYRLRRE